MAKRTMAKRKMKKRTMKKGRKNVKKGGGDAIKEWLSKDSDALQKLIFTIVTATNFYNCNGGICC